MQVQVNTGQSVHGSQELAADVEEGLRTLLWHFTRHQTRIEVHFRAVIAGKGGDAYQPCGFKAHMSGRSPLSVDDDAATFAQAIHGATVKLHQSLQHAICKLKLNRHGDEQNP